MTIQFVKLWLWLSACASAAGWGLSAMGKLNQAGYAIFFVAAAVLLWRARGALGLEWPFRLACVKKLKRRLRRPLPFAFALLSALVFLGAVLYPPTNHTGLTYRLPRVLQWLAHEQWV